MRRLVVTGASGFLGRAVLRAAEAEGADVTATSRSGANPLDLAGPDAAARFSDLLSSAPSTVIHLAGLMSGSDEEHAAGTVGPMRAVLDALADVGRPDDDLPDLVLASSLSVYGYAALPDGATLDETTPLETRVQARDAYARAKLAQERLALEAGQRRGVRVRVLRPGAIVGGDRAWTSRIGVSAKGAALVLGGDAALPLVDVDDCARAFVLAAARPLGRADATIAPGTGGHVEAINVIGSEQPTQGDYLATLDDAPTSVRVPWRLLSKTAEAAGLAGELVPGVARRLPGLARPETLAARAKPLRYSTARAEDRLGWKPEGSAS